MEKLTLAMMAGVHAIHNNKRLLCATFMHDIHGSQQKIKFEEAMALLVEEVERRLNLEENRGKEE
jgi:hypothetical protein